MQNIFPLYLPVYVLPLAAAITALFVLNTLVLGLADRPAWRFQARVASYCSLAVLSAAIATEQDLWSVAALLFFVFWPRPKDSNGQ